MPDFYKLNNSTVGAQLINGSGAPTAGVGIDGDFYLQTSGAGTPKIWGPKASGSWPGSGVSLATSVATDAIFDAAGDLPVGSGADASARLAKGSRTQALVTGASTLEWDANHWSGANFMSSTFSNVTGGSYSTYVAQAETLQGPQNWQAVNAGASGTVHLHGVYLPKGTTVTYLAFMSGASGIGAGAATHQWFALCSNTRTVLRATSNDTSTVWAASTPKVLGLTTPFTTTYSGLYYVACCVVMTGTMVSFRGINIGSATNVLSQSFTSTTALTTPPADGVTFSRPAGNTNTILGAVL